MSDKPHKTLPQESNNSQTRPPHTSGQRMIPISTSTLSPIHARCEEPKTSSFGRQYFSTSLPASPATVQLPLRDSPLHFLQTHVGQATNSFCQVVSRHNLRRVWQWYARSRYHTRYTRGFRVTATPTPRLSCARVPARQIQRLTVYRPDRLPAASVPIKPKTPCAPSVSRSPGRTTASCL